MLWVAVVLGIVLLAISFLLNFYRDPERITPKGNIVVSPADGTIISIIDTKKKIATVNKGFLGKIKTFTNDVDKECYLISIFMSPLNVHVNRAPIEGIVKEIKYTKGKFYKAYDLEKSFENEHNEMLFVGKIRAKAIQISGFLARRIICKIKVNQKVKIGQRIGLIALGSQTTLVLPKKKIDIKVKIGDKVKGAQSIIAHIK